MGVKPVFCEIPLFIAQIFETITAEIFVPLLQNVSASIALGLIVDFATL